jgi:hypothetical protein
MSTVNIGPDKVKQIYKTAPGGTEFYLNTDNPYKAGGGKGTTNATAQFNISFGHGSQLAFTKCAENGFTYFNTAGSPINYKSGGKPGRSVRLDCYPDGGKWNNHTRYSWKSNPGYLYTPKSIASGEFTTYIRVHGNLGSHQSYAHKIGGRDEDDIRSLIEMVYPTATHDDIQVNYNYAHFPYVHVKPRTKFNPPMLADNGKWVGVKTIHKIGADKKSSEWEMWVDTDPIDNDGEPKNNWKSAATYLDYGVPEYNNIPLTWQCHKDVCRVDGFAYVDFTLISDRAIDVTNGLVE